MSEIEQAIAYLERWLPFWKERNEDSALYVELALSALREKAERDNPQPLTLDELREMDREPQPVYLVSNKYAEGNGWKICRGVTDNGMIDFGDEAWAVQVFDERYVVAYRNKPKEATNER